MIAALSLPMRSKKPRGCMKRRMYGKFGQLASISPWPMMSLVRSANPATSVSRSRVGDHRRHARVLDDVADVRLP